MFASQGIEAGGSHRQSLHGLAAHDVRIDDFVDICFGYVPVPYGFRVDHDVGAVLTLIETARLVGPDRPFESALRQFLFEQLLQFGFAARIAAPPRMSSRALVSTNENVMFELGHGDRDGSCVFFLLVILSETKDLCNPAP
jgi:hypothetical protein